MNYSLTNEEIDFIENFDSKNITIAFIIVSGKAASFLLHSLLDNHPEILIFPTVIAFYHDWYDFYPNSNNNKEFFDKFFSKGTINRNWRNNSKDSDSSEQVELRLDEIKECLLEIDRINKISNEKEFILAFHIAYSKVFNIDLSKIKALVVHHHYMKFDENNSEVYNLEDLLSIYLSNKINIFDKSKKDFPNIKYLNSIREPMENIYSICKDAIYPKILFPKITYMFFSYYFVYKNIIQDKIISTYNYKFVRFEDLHTKTELVLKDIAQFLGISFRTSLLESTFNGKPWFGNNPNKIINGTSPDMVTQKWKTELSLKEKSLYFHILKNFFEPFGYPLPLDFETYTQDYSLLLEKESEFFFVSLFNLSKNITIGDNYNAINFFEIFPLVRKLLLNIVSTLKEYKQLDINLKSNSLKYLDTNIIVQYKTIPEINLNEQAYLIQLQYLKSNKVDISNIQFINHNIDQFWVFSNYIKDLYIKNGVNQKKLKLLLTEFILIFITK
jgi:hypothetical protein